MKIMQSRAFALIVCILLIIVSIFFGGRLSLSEVRAQAEAAFTQGTDGSGKGIQYDLDKRIDQANNQIVVAKRYLSADDALITAVTDAITAVQTADTPSEKYAANAQLSAACDGLYANLSLMTLSTEDLRYIVNIKTELASHNEIIAHSDYNELAGAFNDTISKFPTNLVCVIAFIEPLELYQ